MIRLSDILFNYDPLTSDISDFLMLADGTADTYLHVDRAGGGFATNDETIARIEGAAGLWTDVDDMISQGVLEVA